MDVGRGGGRVGLGSLDFEIFSKKGDSLSFEWKKQISPLLAPMEKFSSSRPGKNPSDAHGYRYVGVSASAVSANVT